MSESNPTQSNPAVGSTVLFDNSWRLRADGDTATLSIKSSDGWSSITLGLDSWVLLIATLVQGLPVSTEINYEAIMSDPVNVAIRDAKRRNLSVGDLIENLSKLGGQKARLTNDEVNGLPARVVDGLNWRNSNETHNVSQLSNDRGEPRRDDRDVPAANAPEQP